MNILLFESRLLFLSMLLKCITSCMLASELFNISMSARRSRGPEILTASCTVENYSVRSFFYEWKNRQIPQSAYTRLTASNLNRKNCVPWMGSSAHLGLSKAACGSL